VGHRAIAARNAMLSRSSRISELGIKRIFINASSWPTEHIRYVSRKRCIETAPLSSTAPS
jgi:hypothetical protein